MRITASVAAVWRVAASFVVNTARSARQELTSVNVIAAVPADAFGQKEVTALRKHKISRAAANSVALLLVAMPIGYLVGKGLVTLLLHLGIEVDRDSARERYNYDARRLQGLCDDSGGILAPRV